MPLWLANWPPFSQADAMISVEARPFLNHVAGMTLANMIQCTSVPRTPLLSQVGRNRGGNPMRLVPLCFCGLIGAFVSQVGRNFGGVWEPVILSRVYRRVSDNRKLKCQRNLRLSPLIPCSTISESNGLRCPTGTSSSTKETTSSSLELVGVGGVWNESRLADAS